MESQIHEVLVENTVEDTVKMDAPETPVIDEKTMMDLAKRRIAARRDMIVRTLDFLLLIFFAFMMVGLYDSSDRAAVAILFSLFMGTRYLIRLYKFWRPRFKGGIVAYFRERKEHRLEAEYNKLKKMGAEYITSELSK